MASPSRATADVPASRVIQWRDLCEEERELYTRFIVENGVKVRTKGMGDGLALARRKRLTPPLPLSHAHTATRSSLRT